LDGRYHALRVALRNSRGLTVEARRGYYAPRYADTPADQAKKQIEEAFFSTDEIHELPARVLCVRPSPRSSRGPCARGGVARTRPCSSSGIRGAWFLSWLDLLVVYCSPYARSLATSTLN